MISAGDARLESEIQSTGDFDKPKDFDVGQIIIAAPGIVEVRVTALSLKGGALCNLRSLRFSPE